MTDLMRLNLRATEIRARLSELAGVTDLTDEHRSELDTLRNEYRDNETKTGALMIAGDTPHGDAHGDAHGGPPAFRAARQGQLRAVRCGGPGAARRGRCGT